MAVYEFRFPELGEGLHEGRIEKWLVKPGDEVKEDDVLAEVENDKAVVELPSPVDGKVLSILVEAGATATVGDVIITFEVAGEGNVSSAPAADVKTAAVEQAGLEPATANVDTARSPVPAGAGAGSGASDAAAAPQAPSAATAPAGAGSAQAAASGPSHAREVLATPGVRKLARELGIDITQVPGTGPNGKITREDVEAFHRQGGVPAQAAGGAAAGAKAQEDAAAGAAKKIGAGVAEAGEAALEERVPLPTIRKIIAQAMAKSKYTAPHVTVMDEANVTELVALRQELKPIAAERGVKVTYLPFIVKAMVAALRQFPTLNATYDEERQELVIKHYYHIGIATDTERGLVVPVVRNADRKNMWTIASEIEDLAARARSNKLGPAEMKGSTISITNIGSAGGMFFTPIINYPELAILGVGRITERPIMKDGQVVGAHMMALSLSFDHRMIDGALAQRFINELKRLLENPRLLLMEV
ncbi:dihydrolipoamide acetyltransferase family protein [Alicyclobacillus macrosporangiidus]|uniref:dihydrolipoamide acetyltransferase family protein n=1 Tax=Alicyclobacillus macrosporangiidus TaxID=392015 RepID=UPI0004981E82|nr:dihydrolipoamide acetyltransferase family protein [Alicyclobacillus macrosporangiidus]